MVRMKDRSEWLAKTAEEPLDPDLKICDAHHHLWDRGGHRYLAEEFITDVRGHRVTKSVYVECLSMYRQDGPEALRPVGETEFIEGIASAAQSGAGTMDVAAGIVGFADLTLGAAVGPVLEAHVEASSRFRGIRYATAWDASDKVHNAHTKPSQHLLGDAAFREGFQCLDAFDLTFDAWLYFHQLPELTDLARAFPGTTIILNHLGGPIGVGPYAGRRDKVFATWEAHIAELATCDNVLVKLGGLTMAMAGFDWHKRDKPASSVELAAAMSPYYRACIERFGPDRCMFESNFPVDGTGASCGILWNAFKRAADEYTGEERRALFHDTAARVYKI
jgi:predicted TIM-barrel fold metal-dependent hydrolase